MNRFRVLCRRLLERRLFGDDERSASLIPGSFMTLSVSLLVFTLIAQERDLTEVTLWLSIACLAWSGLKAFFESQEYALGALDHAILTPLPIPPSWIAAARAVATFAVLALGTFNLGLPVAILVAVKYGPIEGALALLAGFVASFVGLAAAQLVRALLERGVGVSRLLEAEGPLRLAVSIGLFAVLFLAPDPAGLVERIPWLAFAPPFSLARLPVLGSDVGRTGLAVMGLLVVACTVLLLSFKVQGRVSHQPGRVRRPRPIGPLRRAMERWVVDDEERASFEFTLVNLARDRTFRARVFPLFAFPFAVILLIVQRPGEPFLSLMALYGAAVYLTLSQTFLGFSESEGGPDLLRCLPIRNARAFRIGSEKAFHVGLVVPIFLALALALAVVALFDRGFPLPLGLSHAVIAALFSVLLCGMTFEREAGLAFSEPDRGVYPADLGGGPMVALLLGAAAALLAAKYVPSPLGFVGSAVALALLIRLLYTWKRRSAASG